jgi:replication factor C subunit 1
MKASNVVAPAKTTKAAPDLEEAFEEEDEGEVVAELKEDDEDIDFKKDKYIKQPKARKVAAGKKGASKKKATNDEDEDSEEDVKQKTGKAKAKGKRSK